MSTLYIIRGLPGSGKSTYAKKLDIPHVEADMYFERNGEYKFDATKLHQAHRWCFRIVETILAQGKDVAVSNTFTTLKEIKNYVELAHKLNCKIVIVECISDYGNIHNVPDELLLQMESRWQQVPSDWYNELITVS